jgi:hypothetical protein
MGSEARKQGNLSLSDFFKSRSGKRTEISLLPPTPAESVSAAPRPGVEFVTVLEAAGVTAEQRSRVGKAQELLRTLPAATPAALKRDIVEAAFKAFDVPTHEIVAAATSEIEALKAFIRGGEERTQQLLLEGNQQISQLEAKIAEVKASMDRAVAEQAMRAQSTLDEIHTVQPVVDFFLHDPSVLGVASHAEVHVHAGHAAHTAHAGHAAPPSEGSQGEGVDIQWEAGR